MRRLPLLCLLPLSVFAGAEGLITRDLPAFTIDLPDGQITKQSPMSGAGALVMLLPTLEMVTPLQPGAQDAGLLPSKARQIQVQWDPSVVANDEDRKLVIDTVLGVLPIENSRVLREKELADGGHLYVVGNERFPVGIGLSNCGTSLGLSVTMAFTLDLDALVVAGERILSSVNCKQVSEALERPQPALRLPKEFGRKFSEGVEMFLSTEGEMLVVGFAPQDLQRHPGLLEKIMASMFGTVLGIPEGGLTIDPVSVRGVVGAPSRSQTSVIHTKGDLDGAYLHATYCASQDATLFAVWYAEQSTLEKARTRFGQVGCPGEPSEPVREMSVVFDGACKQGNAVACQMLEEIDDL